jgi:hypothetical protein
MKREERKRKKERQEHMTESLYPNTSFPTPDECNINSSIKKKETKPTMRKDRQQ